MKRIFDLILAMILLVVFSGPMVIIAILVKLTSKGPALFWSDRVGKGNVIFKMPKYRTMRVDTPAVATHLLTNHDQYCTAIGKFLRKFSIDELPQLFSVIRGNMSFVGPRPALFNQDDLIELRTQKGIHKLIPGVTPVKWLPDCTGQAGWAQVNGRDDLPIPVKVEFDEYYLKNRSFLFDLKILWMTFVKVVKREGVTH